MFKKGFKPSCDIEGNFPEELAKQHEQRSLELLDWLRSLPVEDQMKWYEKQLQGISIEMENLEIKAAMTDRERARYDDLNALYQTWQRRLEQLQRGRNLFKQAPTPKQHSATKPLTARAIALMHFYLSKYDKNARLTETNIEKVIADYDYRNPAGELFRCGAVLSEWRKLNNQTKKEFLIFSDSTDKRPSNSCRQLIDAYESFLGLLAGKSAKALNEAEKDYEELKTILPGLYKPKRKK